MSSMLPSPQDISVAGTNASPGTRRRLGGLGHPVDPVVVGEGERRHAGLGRGRDDRRGRELPVGEEGMALKVQHGRGSI